MDANGIFNTSGKIPSQSNFWEDAKGTFTSTEGITAGFGRVIGEQVFRPVKSPQTAFYNEFAGRPIMAGRGWVERAVAKTVAKKRKGKATASDDLGFYDSSGIEKVFEIDYEGWRPVSLPSELDTAQLMYSTGGVGTLNGILVDNVLMDYQRDMESAVQKKLISCTKSEATVDLTDAEDIFSVIRELSAKMQGTTTHYNELTPTENDKIYTNTGEVLCFLPIETFNFMMSSRATLPSPGELITNVRFIPTADGLAKPITAAELAAGQDAGAQGWGLTSPVALGKDAPDIFLVSKDKCEVRPLIGSYRVNLTKNGAGDFMNQHMLWSCAIGVKPWENGIRINHANPAPVIP